MTIAMEAAIAPTATAPSSTPIIKPATAVFKPISRTSEASKPAANPFVKVLGKTATPSLVCGSSTTPATGNRPTPHGSGNILKSRTVTSFISGSAAAPSSCGGGRITSFVNNENTNSGNITSFLKSKDSAGGTVNKHRSVVLSGKKN